MAKNIHPLGLAVLLALAPTAYAAGTQDIEKGKKQIEEAVVFINQQKDVVKNKILAGKMPTDNIDAGLVAAEDLNSKYIREIKIGENLLANKIPGAITATFYNDEPVIMELRGRKLTFVPINREPFLYYKFNCLSNIGKEYLPEKYKCEHVSNENDLKHYMIREQVAEAAHLINEQKLSLTTYHRNRDAWPEDNKIASLADSYDIRGKYVKEVRVGVNLTGDKQPGVITATLYNEEPVAPELRGKKLSYVPSEKDGAYQWDCVSNIDSQYLPEPCRHVDK